MQSSYTRVPGVRILYTVKPSCDFYLFAPSVSEVAMKKEISSCLFSTGVFILCGLLFAPSATQGQEKETPGHSIGKVSTHGDLIVMELDESVLGKKNLFDLDGRTLRF